MYLITVKYVVVFVFKYADLVYLYLTNNLYFNYYSLNNSVMYLYFIVIFSIFYQIKF